MVKKHRRQFSTTLCCSSCLHTQQLVQLMPYLEPSSWVNLGVTQRHQHTPKAVRALKARSSSHCCSAEPGAAHLLQEEQHSPHHPNSTLEAPNPGGWKRPPETF